jgi:hypothetical protein
MSFAMKPLTDDLTIATPDRTGDRPSLLTIPPGALAEACLHRDPNAVFHWQKLVVKEDICHN